MRFQTLQEWLDWQETLHPCRIDLGLDRVRGVLDRLESRALRCPIITVGGTNGKGSCVAVIQAILGAAGYRVGAYTSPHLLRYNERIRIADREATDTDLCAAFDRVDRARGSVSLSYFEFGTLAALDLFRRADVDVAILEVGMGGRLDAVNVLDADVAVVTSVGVDHVRWLGPDRETIGREKAGIFRAGRPAICGDPEPPQSLLNHAASIGTHLKCLDRDFGVVHGAGEWRWWSRAYGEWVGLPPLTLSGDFQYRNAAAGILAIRCLSQRLPVDHDGVCTGLRRVRLDGRFQRLPGAVETIVDVAHNPESVTTLAANLRARTLTGRTYAVLGMLEDKDVHATGRILGDLMSAWFTADLDDIRGVPAAELAERLRSVPVPGPVEASGSVTDAYHRARLQARPGDRIVVFGSFRTVADFLEVGAEWPVEAVPGGVDVR